MFGIHDELGGSQQTLQRRLGSIGRILLEGLLQIVLEQSVGAIILARVLEVSEDLFEFAEEQRLRIGWHVAFESAAMNRKPIAMMDCGSVNNVKVCASYTRARMRSST
jgi:hypothetical protein